MNGTGPETSAALQISDGHDASSLNGGSTLRILMVCAQFRPIVGGYERAAERLSNALAARGHHVDVVTERRDRAWPRLELSGRIRIIRLPCLYRRHLHTLTALVSLAAFMLSRRDRYDVVHVHQYGVSAALAIMLARLNRSCTVLKLRSTGTQGIAVELMNFSFGSLLAFAHRQVDACVAPSTTGCQEAISFGIPEERVHLVPNGLDTQHFKPADADTKSRLRERFRLGGGPLVLFLARLVEAKEPGLLLDAWVTVMSALPSAQLVVVGDGPERQRMMRHPVVRNGHVRMVGESEDVVGWHQASDLFVICSSREGLSNSLLEALSCGIPVVSTNVSGSIDIFSRADVGELVAFGDPAELAAAILRMLRAHDRRRACGRNARALVLRDFSVEKVALRTEHVYRSALCAALTSDVR
jgi:glycosyltransferase involved in cell wall biosynthesis